MRILYSHYLLHEDHPAGYMVQAIARQLRGLGHEVRVHASAGRETTAKVASPPRPTAPRPLAALRATVWFAKAIARDLARSGEDEAAVERFRPEVVLVRQDPYCWSMTRAARRLGVPVVTYADAPAAYEARQRNQARRWHPPGLPEAIERWGLQHSAAVVTVSRPAADLLRGYRLHVPIHAVPNGVDLGGFPHLTEGERGAERRLLGLTAPLIVAFQGTFKAVHGIDRLYDLMLGVSSRVDTQWLLIGDGPERPSLQAAVSGKMPAVFLGRQPNERMGKLLGLADVGVAPYARVPGTFFECPLKVLEYAAAGCAVMASDQGDIPALLDRGQAGVVLPTNDTDAWCRELHRLLDDRHRREALGARAREWVGRHFTWKHTAARVSDVLAGVLEQQPLVRSRRPGRRPTVLPGEEQTVFLSSNRSLT